MFKNKISKIKCAFCQGKGIQPGSERLSCIVCRGTGKIQVTQPYDICKECSGNGKKQGANLHCLLCKGKGVIETSRSTQGVESMIPRTKRKKKKSPKKKSVKKPVKAKKIPVRVIKIKQKSAKKTKKKKSKSFFAGLLSYLGII